MYTTMSVLTQHRIIHSTHSPNDSDNLAPIRSWGMPNMDGGGGGGGLYARLGGDILVDALGCDLRDLSGGCCSDRG